ncbi:GntR family transcriptional regulator [Agrococcus jejuensis]|uniref:DNA-binding transcriptional regulator YhcF, GntR family n=1 Tax=Agrococcus jejuensis TaxID=399736 RepID=A0A1G8EVK6_9MICO|nr:GntR family transcriptional regulator [Agrococcus jejuensis]SDH73890.1 DNA-binding transcriptional regulator YhcF, GntR family [Agrococcus jejuensis]
MTPLAPDSADGIAELLRGAIRSGRLGDGDRLPTVRQTARDFGVAQATAAKAYRALEQEGLVVTRTAAGTRVAPGASRAPADVVASARALVEVSEHEGVAFDDVVGVLRALWPAPSTDDASDA